MDQNYGSFEMKQNYGSFKINKVSISIFYSSPKKLGNYVKKTCKKDVTFNESTFYNKYSIVGQGSMSLYKS